jgi:hypothetical protein
MHRKPHAGSPGRQAGRKGIATVENMIAPAASRRFSERATPTDGGPADALAGTTPARPDAMTQRRARLSHAVWLAAALMAVTAGCAGPGEIRFSEGGCTIDGRPADLPRVEAREAAVQHRIARLQPWLVAITVAIVSLAGIGYLERLVMLFSARRDARGMGERLQAVVDRYRSHPVRYFTLLCGSIGLLVAAGSLYIYCDADKRSSERALAALQFCHLAQRSADENRALDDQRQNLSSIHETAGAIRQLIDKLPPAEQAKASEIINHMDDAVGRERRVISEHLQRSEESTVALSTEAQAIARGLGGLATDVGSLKGLPGDVRALADALGKVDGRAAAADDKLAAANDKLAEAGVALSALAGTVKELAARPAPACPACVCNERAPAAAAGSAPSIGGAIAGKVEGADRP